jgi:hypothetical protein
MNRARMPRRAAAVVVLLGAGAAAVVVFAPTARAAEHARGTTAEPAPRGQPGATSGVMHRVPPAQAVADRYGAAVVVVVAGGRRAHGFFVSSDGVLCTVLPGAAPGDAVVIDGSDAAGSVAVVDDDGLALVVVPTASGVVRAALGVATGDALSDRWLVGLARDEHGVVRGSLGDVVDKDAAHLRLLLPLPRGAPVLNGKHDVVAVAVVGHNAGVVQAVPASRVLALAARLQAARTSATTPQTTP